jgi:hypothetical protein
MSGRPATQGHELRTLALALLGSLLLWNLPSGGVLLYPFKLLATWLHELSHGIAMVLAGAGFDRIVLYRDTSGLAYASSTPSGVATWAPRCGEPRCWWSPTTPARRGARCSRSPRCW